MKARKKQVEVDFIHWNGDNINEICNFMNWRNVEHDRRSGLVIHTLEGQMKAKVGDIIIKGIKGEFYPCKPDIFDLTYSIVAPEKSIEEATDTQVLEIYRLSGLNTLPEISLKIAKDFFNKTLIEHSVNNLPAHKWFDIFKYLNKEGLNFN